MKKIALTVGHTLSIQGKKNRVTSEYLFNYEIAARSINIVNSLCENKIQTDLIAGAFKDFGKYDSIREKCNIVNRRGYDYAIELHCNSCINPFVNGTETYYYPGSQKGRRIADVFQDNILHSLKLRDRGIKEKKYIFLEETNCPAIIVEPFFMHGTYGDCMVYQGFKEIYSIAIARSILEI